MNEDVQLQNNRLVLLTIVGIPVMMIFTATWLWYFVISGDLDLVGTLGTSNRGVLVTPPRQLDDHAMADDVAAPVMYADLPRKWTLLVPDNDGSCDRACEQSLYVTRQIHIAMGKEFTRIRRLYLSERSAAETELALAQLSDQRPAPPSFAELLATEHRGLAAFTLTGGGFGALFPELADDASTWYLVDPAGWVMMSYHCGIHYRDVIADLKFLLKNSSE